MKKKFQGKNYKHLFHCPNIIPIVILFGFQFTLYTQYTVDRLQLDHKRLREKFSQNNIKVSEKFFKH